MASKPAWLFPSLLIRIDDSINPLIVDDWHLVPLLLPGVIFCDKACHEVSDVDAANGACAEDGAAGWAEDAFNAEGVAEAGGDRATALN